MKEQESNPPPSSNASQNKASRLSSESQTSFKSQSSSTKSFSGSSSHRSNSVGLAEQLRRSRESNTFALIDSELSKSPLGRIRELYLSLRGVNSNNGNAPRTTKKANLSAVHTIVRFRIKEYLMEMREHSRKLAETLVSHDPSYNSVSDLLTPYPCSKDCQHCDKFQCRLELRRTVNKKYPGTPQSSNPHFSNANQSSTSSSNNNSSKIPASSLVTTRNSPSSTNKTNFEYHHHKRSMSSVSQEASTLVFDFNNNNNNMDNLVDIKPTIGLTSSESNKSCDYSSPPDFPSPGDPQSSDFEDIFYSSMINENEVMLTSLSSGSNDDVKQQPSHIKRAHNDSFNPSKNYNDYFIDSLNWSPCEMDFTQTAADMEVLMGSNAFDFATDCDDIADSLCPVSTDEELPVLVS